MQCPDPHCTEVHVRCCAGTRKRNKKQCGVTFTHDEECAQPRGLKFDSKGKKKKTNIGLAPAAKVGDGVWHECKAATKADTSVRAGSSESGSSGRHGLAEWAIASEMPRAAGSLTSRAAPEPVSTVTDGRPGKAGMTVPCSRSQRRE